MLECLLGKRAENALEAAEAMAEAACAKVVIRDGGHGGVLKSIAHFVQHELPLPWKPRGFDHGDCDSLSALAQSMGSTLHFARAYQNTSRVPALPKEGAAGKECHFDDGAESGEELGKHCHIGPQMSATEHRNELDHRQRHVESELDDRANSYTSSAAVDSLIDAILEVDDGDINEDGVRDMDRDGDGLPDDVEDGLGVLRELLDEIESGAYHGRWDGDGGKFESRVKAFIFYEYSS